MDSPIPRFQDLEATVESSPSADSSPTTPRALLPDLADIAMTGPPRESPETKVPSDTKGPQQYSRGQYISRERFNSLLPAIISPASVFRTKEADIRQQLRYEKARLKNLAEMKVQIELILNSLDTQIQSLDM